MSNRSRTFKLPTLVLTVLVSLVALEPIRAEQVPPVKQKVKKEKAKPQKARAQVPPLRRVGKARAQPRKVYVGARNGYRHVRVSKAPRRADGKLDARAVIIRSAGIRPAVLRIFEDRTQAEVRLVIRHFREGRRNDGLRVWGTFVESLADHRGPVDLDEIMLYVTRESCFGESDSVLFHAARLSFQRDSAQRLEYYVDELSEQLEACITRTRACSSSTVGGLRMELARARADHEILGIEEALADEEFGATLRARDRDQAQFAAIFDGLYREVELRIRFSK